MTISMRSLGEKREAPHFVSGGLLWPLSPATSPGGPLAAMGEAPHLRHHPGDFMTAKRKESIELKQILQEIHFLPWNNRSRRVD